MVVRKLVLAVALVAALTGCGDGDGVVGVATAEGTPGASAGSGKANDQEQALKYAQCLRENGFPTFPDPDPDAGGIVLDDDADIDTKTERFQTAQKKCGMDKPPPSPSQARNG